MGSFNHNFKLVTLIINTMKFSLLLCLVIQIALGSSYGSYNGYQVANTYTYQQYQPSSSSYQRHQPTYRPVHYYYPHRHSSYPRYGRSYQPVSYIPQQHVYTSLYQPPSYLPSYNQRVAYSSYPAPVYPIYPLQPYYVYPRHGRFSAEFIEAEMEWLKGVTDMYNKGVNDMFNIF